jgi:hypothetical protein
MIGSAPPEVAMLVVSDSLDEGILLDIELARADLLDAEQARRIQNDPAAQHQIDACWATIDTILDMWIEAGGPSRN